MTPLRLLETVLFSILAPVLVPALGLRVGYETWARALGWPLPRRRGAWPRIWWWYGYHGLFQVDWWMKRRAG